MADAPRRPEGACFCALRFITAQGTPSANASALLVTRPPKAETLKLVFVIAPSGQDFDA
jgi:hypothetical protein